MTVTVREQVCAVLLKGESVIATEFAKVAGCTGGAVADVLGRLQALSLVKAKKIKRGKFYLKSGRQRICRRWPLTGLSGRVSTSVLASTWRH
ncbi:hypothetical protein AU476_07370 [Cupriavidus sp. UYMSc13B]|nr:hypothetical protein AU476_07370 [Cupriavidus sp. UYMSc13B]